jgi:hypothetical protein
MRKLPLMPRKRTYPVMSPGQQLTLNGHAVSLKGSTSASSGLAFTRAGPAPGSRPPGCKSDEMGLVSRSGYCPSDR